MFDGEELGSFGDQEEEVEEEEQAAPPQAEMADQVGLLAGMLDDDEYEDSRPALRCHAPPPAPPSLPSFLPHSLPPSRVNRVWSIGQGGVVPGVAESRSHLGTSRYQNP